MLICFSGLNFKPVHTLAALLILGALLCQLRPRQGEPLPKRPPTSTAQHCQGMIKAPQCNCRLHLIPCNGLDMNTEEKATTQIDMISKPNNKEVA